MSLPPRETLLPFVSVLKCCIDIPKPSVEYQGEWPKKGESYVVDLFTPADGPPRIYVRGLTAPPPYDSFPYKGWAHVATTWLN